MADKKNSPIFVIADADEGVQINAGTRLGFAGSGFMLDGFEKVVEILKKELSSQLRVVSSGESDWIKQKLDLKQWDEVDAMAQQHLQSLADEHELLYAGFMPFADPQDVDYQVKGHMVRPHSVHLANKICFTLGGGEQKYNLGQFVISADWLYKANKKLVKQVISQQVDFLQSLSSVQLKYVCQTGGVLGEKIAKKNKVILEGLGFQMQDVE